MKPVVAIFMGAMLTACGQPQARQQDASKPAGTPDQFDYYVLAMSWSPQHCSARGANDPLQCAGERLYDFVLHGLWPQYEKGYPADCTTGTVGNTVVDSMLDIMPSKSLIRHEWKKHGTCSGMEPETYFAKAREAFQSVRIPRQYRQPKVQVVTTPVELRSRFAKENANFPRDSFAAVCSGRFLSEVRACLTKDFRPRACSADVLRSQCKAPEIILRPVR
jgi:ribonuclease T2